MSQILHFQAILQINLTRPWTFICDLSPHEHVKVPTLHQYTKFVPIRLQLFKWGELYILSSSYILTSDDLWPWYMTFDHMNIQRVNTPSLVPIRLKLFKWGHFYIFSLSFNLTSDDLWPWYMTFDLINKWGFPCCIYDPTLVDIHQSMWKVEPNVDLFSQQTTINSSGQSNPYVFSAKAGDTKWCFSVQRNRNVLWSWEVL